MPLLILQRIVTVNDERNRSASKNSEPARFGALNQEGFCITLDRDALCQALEREVGDPEFCATFIKTRPHLFSNAPVFLSVSDTGGMIRVLHTIEAAIRLPAYRDAILSWAPDIAQRDFGPRGVFTGYDFHTLRVGFPDRVEALGLKCFRFEYSRKIAIVGEEMNAPRQLSNERLGVGVGPRSACCPADVRDHQQASQVVIGDELNPIAVRDCSRFLEQADVQSFIIADAPTVSVCSGGSAVLSELRQRKIQRCGSIAR